MTAAALPCFEVGVATLCEQVHIGRSTNFKCTACQPTLGKKPIKDWEKPLTLWKKQSTWNSCHADGWKEHRAARLIKSPPDEGEVVRWEIGMIHYNNIRAKGEH